MEKKGFPQSKVIRKAQVDRFRLHKGDGDMWPITWADDGNLYGAAGDNQGSPMNIWKIEGHPDQREWMPTPYLYLQNNLPLEPKKYCTLPGVNKKWGLKPASLLCVEGVLYLSVQQMNFGDCEKFNRQHNLGAAIFSSRDYGLSWKQETGWDFFSSRLGAPHFIQFGKNYEGARDSFVYAYFPSSEDGESYWDNGDFLLLGRTPKEALLSRESWRFYSGDGQWSAEEDRAKAVFTYPKMTGENHVSYNAGLKRYLMGNYSFTDEKGNPMPYHQDSPLWDPYTQRSQLTIFEAPEPWGPWSLFYQDNDWGNHGGYNPSFPTKWMSGDGKELWMAYSGSEEDYNFTLQKIRLELYE